MTFTDAAAEVLRLVGKPLHYKEITDIAIEKNLLSHVGKSPEVTMGARLAATLKKDSSENPLVRVKPGVFALREWDEKTIKAGLDSKKGAKKGARPELPPPSRGRAKADDDEVLVPATDEDGELVVEDSLDEPEDEAPRAHGDIDLIDADTDEREETPAAEVAAQPASSSPDRPRHDRAPHAARPVRAPEERGNEREEPEYEEPTGPDDVMRAEAAAGAAEMFDEEEDDDQPILGGTDDRAAAAGTEAGGEGRRRRRRRRRGRSGNGEPAPSGGGLPSYTATPAFEARQGGNREFDRRPQEGGGGREFDRRPQEGGGGREFDRRPQEGSRDASSEAAYRGPQVIELTNGEGHALDDLAGRELSDAIAVILSTFDRNAGAVSLRQIAETAQRRGRLNGDAQLVQSQVAAAVRADNARRIAAGQRARFRLAGGRVALTDWLLSGDLARLEQEALAAVERYRDAARRAFARKLAELPGHAFVEVCVLALERMGVSQLRAVRRPGAPSGETHFSGVLRGGIDDLRIGLVIRRDGREVGRERVTELRGSLHHYGLATAGWICTSGQMLSGAREEASIPGTPPITLHDGLSVARLCEDNDVAVLRARLPIAIPDVDLLEALRAS
jgi:HB1, ASXL, restriction endonuclease HTH domain/Restriction endonuclease